MSHVLLDDFLREVQAAHPGFRESTSSLSRLFAELRRQLAQDRCRVMNTQAALAMCGNPNDPRLAKYIPALDRLCSSWGVVDAGAKYVYLPGLARDDFVEQEDTKLDDKIAAAFRDDGYITDVVRYWKQRGATVLDCGRPLRWVLVSAHDKLFNGKKHTLRHPAREVTRPGILGKPSENLLGKRPGAAPVAPKFDYRTNVASSYCYVARRLAQPMTSTPPLAKRGIWKANLRGVGARDTLYIIGHCNETGASLSYKMPTAARCADGACTKKHTDLFSVDAVTLAALLIDEGLTTNLERIEVVGCFTGGVEVEAVQSVQPFAQRLAGALAGFGFSRLKVAGAMGLTSAPRRGGLVAQGKMTREAGGYFVEDGDAAYAETRRWFPAISH